MLFCGHYSFHFWCAKFDQSLGIRCAVDKLSNLVIMNDWTSNSEWSRAADFVGGH